jgi:hypothetical protein
MERTTAGRAAGAWLLAAAAFAACGGPRIDVDESQSFRDASRTHTVEAQVGEGMDEVRLRLALELDRGTLAFRVRDPQGVARWEGEITGGGRLRDRREFPALPGTWRLDLEMREASGEYEARWAAR